MGTDKHRFLGIGLMFSACGLIGCGGAAPEPQSAPLESDPAPVSDAPMADDDVEPADDVDEPAPTSNEPASAADVQEAFQVVLNDDALQRALNLSEPGHFPVKISGANLPSDLKLEVGSKPVEVIPEPEDPK